MTTFLRAYSLPILIPLGSSALLQLLLLLLLIVLDKKLAKHQPSVQPCLSAAYLDTDGMASPRAQKLNLAKTTPM